MKPDGAGPNPCLSSPCLRWRAAVKPGAQGPRLSKANNLPLRGQLTGPRRTDHKRPKLHRRLPPHKRNNSYCTRTVLQSTTTGKSNSACHTLQERPTSCKAGYRSPRDVTNCHARFPTAGEARPGLQFAAVSSHPETVSRASLRVLYVGGGPLDDASDQW